MNEQYIENNENENITIPINRLKILWYLLGSLGLFVMGVMVFFGETNWRYSVLELKLIGFFCMLFSVFGMVAFITQFFQKGLIISEKGIEDYCPFISLGLIEWENIDNISVDKIGRGQYVIIVIKPETKDFYLGKVKNPLKKWLMKINFKKYGYTIPINFLKIKPEELEIILIKNIKK